MIAEAPLSLQTAPVLFPMGSVTSKPKRIRFRRVYSALIAAVLGFVAINIALFKLAESNAAKFRDPEYGYRVESLKRRSAEYPHRPLVVVLGSSRTAQGIKPEAPQSPDEPLLFNLSQCGGGPFSQLLTLRRLRREGIQPTALIVEFWPPFLRGDGKYHEQLRLDSKRLLPGDETTVREFFFAPEIVWKAREGDSALPIQAHRRMVQTQLAPDLIPHTERTDPIWNAVDGWGWWPGRVGATPEQIENGMPVVEKYYRPLFADYAIAVDHDRVYRQLFRECRELNIPIAVVRMPEAETFTRMQTLDSIRLSDEYLERLKTEFEFPLIDARRWSSANHLPDGFHLTQSGGAEFTERFRAVAWPLLKDRLHQPSNTRP